MKKLICVFLVAFTVSVSAQKMLIGPRAGMNFSNMTNVNGSESLSGFTGGVTWEYRFLDFMGVSVDALYSAEGAKYTVDIADVDFTYKSRLNYLRVPVLANIYLGASDAKVRPKILLGPSFGFLLNAESEIEVGGFSTEVGMDESDFSSFDFGAIAGLGLDFGLSEKMFLNLDGRYYFGATKVFDVDLEDVNDVNNTGATATVGLTFVLGQ